MTETTGTTADRATLVYLCEHGVVPVAHWTNRDTADAQSQLGTALALLRAGCEFYSAGDPADTTKTIWIRIAYPGFNAFEMGHEPHNYEHELFYIPTAARLDRVAGKDWY